MSKGAAANARNAAMPDIEINIVRGDLVVFIFINFLATESSWPRDQAAPS
jgi:hypothetical protein